MATVLILFVSQFILPGHNHAEKPVMPVDMIIVQPSLFRQRPQFANGERRAT
jgi:hypothetical protein